MDEIVVTSSRELQRLIGHTMRAALEVAFARREYNVSAPKEWLTNKEAMEFLGLSKTSLQRFRKAGRLPFSKMGGSIYYRYSDLVSILENNLRRGV